MVKVGETISEDFMLVKNLKIEKNSTRKVVLKLTHFISQMEA